MKQIKINDKVFKINDSRGINYTVIDIINDMACINCKEFTSKEWVYISNIRLNENN